jgi:hypothetical protein
VKKNRSINSLLSYFDDKTFLIWEVGGERPKGKVVVGGGETWVVGWIGILGEGGGILLVPRISPPNFSPVCYHLDACTNYQPTK